MIEGRCHCGGLHWSYEGDPGEATACNCTVCRRYGVLWIYGWEDHGVTVSGETRFYSRGEREIEFHFCPTCGNVGWWRGHRPRADGRTRIAVNVRLAEPADVGRLPVRKFDGLGAFEDLPRDGRCVADLWY